MINSEKGKSMEPIIRDIEKWSQEWIKAENIKE